MYSPKSLKIFIMVYEFERSKSRLIGDTKYIMNDNEGCLITV